MTGSVVVAPPIASVVPYWLQDTTRAIAAAVASAPLAGGQADADQALQRAGTDGGGGLLEFEQLEAERAGEHDDDVGQRVDEVRDRDGEQRVADTEPDERSWHSRSSVIEARRNQRAGHGEQERRRPRQPAQLRAQRLRRSRRGGAPSCHKSARERERHDQHCGRDERR